MPLHLTRNTFPHIFGHLSKVVLVVFCTCKLVNWQSSEKRRMIINLTVFYTINLINLSFRREIVPGFLRRLQLIICYSRLSRDLIAAMLVFLNKETAALASQTNPQVIEL